MRKKRMADVAICRITNEKGEKMKTKIKRTWKLIITVILCAIIAAGGIGTETAYAAGNTSLKITFKGKTVVLMKKYDSENWGCEVELQTLKKKWGKPKKTIENDTSTYTWKKGKTVIGYSIDEISKSVGVTIKDKNAVMYGVKVGMKKSEALKKLKKAYGVKAKDIDSEGILSVVKPNMMYGATVSFKNGKVSEISFRSYSFTI